MIRPETEDMLKAWYYSLPPGHPVSQPPRNWQEAVLNRYPHLAPRPRGRGTLAGATNLYLDSRPIANDIVSAAAAAHDAYHEFGGPEAFHKVKGRASDLLDRIKRKIRKHEPLPPPRVTEDRPIDSLIRRLQETTDLGDVADKSKDAAVDEYLDKYNGGYEAYPQYGTGYPHGYSGFSPWRKLRERFSKPKG